MGYGAYMVVKNDTSRPVRTLVTDVNCIFDNGEERSNISIFNDAIIAGNSSLPASGSQYIEAKNSGTCFFEASTFKLKIMNEDGTMLSVIDFWDRTAHWNYTQDTSDWVSVFVNNTSEQGTIKITVLHAGPGTGLPTGDEVFTSSASPQPTGPQDGDDLKKGTAGHDAQNRRWKGEDEDDDLKKGTAGHDAQNRRWKGEDEDDDLKKGTAGHDAQNRRWKGEDEDDDLKKGTAGHDAQNRRWKGEDEDDDLKKGTAGHDAQNRRWKGEDEDDDLKKGTAGHDAQNRRWKGEDEDDDLKKGTAGHDAQNRRWKGEDEDDDLKKGTAGHDAQNRRWKGEDEG